MTNYCLLWDNLYKESELNLIMKRMSLKVSDEMYSLISTEAENRALTMNAVVIFALENYYSQKNNSLDLSTLQLLVERIKEDNQEMDQR